MKFDYWLELELLKNNNVKVSPIWRVNQLEDQTGNQNRINIVFIVFISYWQCSPTPLNKTLILNFLMTEDQFKRIWPLSCVFIFGRYQNQSVSDQLPFDFFILGRDFVLNATCRCLVLFRYAEARVRVHFKYRGFQVFQ